MDVKQKKISSPLNSEEPVDEIIPYQAPPIDPSKTGNKPKQLVAVEVYGYVCGRGRTQRVVFPNDIFKLSQMGCTDREIAQWFDMSESTLRYNFSDVLEKGRIQLKQTLRQAMIHNAIVNNNAAVQIFLSKNLLGYRDTPLDTEDNKILPFSDDDVDIIDSKEDDV